MKKVLFVLIPLATSIALLQFIKPKKPIYVPIKDLDGVSDEVNSILRISCFDCHSTETDLAWYDNLTPANFLVYDHIRKGRQAIDFSKWDSLTPAKQNATLYYSINKILEGEMPLPSYTAIHTNAKLSDKDIEVFKCFLKTKSTRESPNSIQTNVFSEQSSDFHFSQFSDSAKQVTPNANGIQYIPDYRNWTVISITDRFDNQTIRLIYGNDIAVKAIRERTINPWPNGSILAKAAWRQMSNDDGNISTGEFVQVEFMIKDEKKYTETAGWGWARWLGKELKPYGGKAILTSECISCHKPLKNNDFVFTKPFNLTQQFNKK